MYKSKKVPNKMMNLDRSQMSWYQSAPRNLSPASRRRGAGAKNHYFFHYIYTPFKTRLSRINNRMK